MERFAAWFWRHYRHRLRLGVFLVVALSQVFGILPSAAALLAILVELTLREALQLYAACCAVVLFADLVAILLWPSRWFRSILQWTRGEETDVVAAWRAGMLAGQQSTLRAVLIAFPFQVALIVWVADRADVGVGGGLWLFLALAAIDSGAVVIYALGLHLLLRPAIDELAAVLPPGVEPDDRVWGLHGRFTAGIANVAVLAGFSTAAITSLADDAGERVALAAGGGVAVGLYLTFFSRIGLIVPTLQPVRELSAAVRRVSLGDLTTPVPQTSADELGDLAAAFNRMQTGLREREALHAAFGSYVDPSLAQRLLDQGSSVFDGERREVTVMFADVRDFTSYAEQVDPEDAVARLNALFDLVVPVLHDHGGGANHYLGDGLLAVFGAPNPLQRHADEAVAAAIEIQRRARAELDPELRLGIGINTGPVIAGTVGGGGRHEFTVIGDTVNVAARVEQLTKETGDGILITEATRAALSPPRPRATKRGGFDLRGKAAAVVVHAVAVPRRS